MFTWKPLYAEIAEKLLEFQDDSQALVKLMMKLAGQGLLVSRYMDKDAEGNEFPLEEIAIRFRNFSKLLTFPFRFSVPPRLIR